MEPKNVTIGKIVYIANPDFNSVEKLKVVGLRCEDLFGDGNLSKFMDCQRDSVVFDGEKFVSSRSMRDANIVPNNYNAYKTFFTPSAAYKYAKQALTESITTTEGE